jgi:topoisomerase-4 subunit A
MPDDVRALTLTETNFSEALEERYLAYALSTITARSLPDVRDGLKPVHRRIIYAMQQLKLDPQSGFKKCARVVGDVMGKFHPHGDSSIYEALVRLAQEFNSRYPLVEGQGNFGNIDGDAAAAMRYTESRMTLVAEFMLEGIHENAIDFRPTYDGEDHEPVILPAAFPNLLANGAIGIAVGMATSIPPHNVTEVCQAAVALIRDPAITTAGLLQYVKGPDFPTGGELVASQEALESAYETGRGGLRTRAKWIKEDNKHGLWNIVVTEIPYMVVKAKLIEQIAQLLNDKRLPLLADLRDESAEDMRIVLEPRNKFVDPAVLMASLFKITQLEQSFNFNMNVLDAKRAPRVLGLKDMIQHWLNHRYEVLVRRTNFRLDAIARRMEILAGYLLVYLNLDEVIRIIREEDEPKVAMITAFGLTENQLEAVLNMRLRSLRRLEEMELRKEYEGLQKEGDGLKEMLASDSLLWNKIESDTKTIGDKFGKTVEGKRRTLVGAVVEEPAIMAEAFVEREQITVILSAKGWIRAIRGHAVADADLKFKDGDKLGFIVKCENIDKISLLTTNGRVFTIKANDVPRGRGDGQAIRLLADIPNDADILKVFVPISDMKYMIASTAGKGFLIKGEELISGRKAGKPIMTLKDKEQTKFFFPVAGDHVAVIGDNRRILLFPIIQMIDLPSGGGVILQRYKDGGLSDIKTFNIADGLTWTIGDKIKTEKDVLEYVGNRAATGRLPPHGFPRNNKFYMA